MNSIHPISLALATALATALSLACGPAASEATEDEPSLESTSQAATINLISNGAFSASTTSWWNGANTQSRVENGQWRLDVSSGPAHPWGAGAGHSGVPPG